MELRLYVFIFKNRAHFRYIFGERTGNTYFIRLRNEHKPGNAKFDLCSNYFWYDPVSCELLGILKTTMLIHDTARFFFSKLFKPLTCELPLLRKFGCRFVRKYDNSFTKWIPFVHEKEPPKEAWALVNELNDFSPRLLVTLLRRI